MNSVGDHFNTITNQIKQTGKRTNGNMQQTPEKPKNSHTEKERQRSIFMVHFVEYGGRYKRWY
jgi:hypothetical protein